MNVLLIHLNESGSKLAAEDELLRRLLKDIPASDMLTFARFWRARDRLQWKITALAGANVLLTVKSAEDVHGLTFDFSRQVVGVDAGATVLPDHHRIVLPDLRANELVAVHVRYER